MDYEKDYKEALERARKLYNDCVKGDNPIQAQRYVDIFPELNEQPDPRHSLIEFIKWSCDRGSITPEQRKNVDFWLAYLEKQKKQKPESCDCSRDEESYTNGIHHVLMNPEAYGLIKQQPAEWSEEDEGMLNCIIATLCEESHGGRETNDKMVAWLENRLKSLRPQPKAKLTLLDENIITAAIAFVEQNEHFNCWCGIDKHTVIKALRSLKPHWKPSDEQMNALSGAIKCELSAGLHTRAGILQSLLDDLEKL